MHFYGQVTRHLAKTCKKGFSRFLRKSVKNYAHVFFTFFLKNESLWSPWSHFVFFRNSLKDFSFLDIFKNVQKQEPERLLYFSQKWLSEVSSVYKMPEHVCSHDLRNLQKWGDCLFTFFGRHVFMKKVKKRHFLDIFKNMRHLKHAT